MIDHDITREDAADWHRMSAIFERQTPNWPPGTAFGYHALTIGWLVEQLVRRVDAKHRTVGQFVRDELCAPFGTLNSFGVMVGLDLVNHRNLRMLILGDEPVYIGLPPELDQHVARIHLSSYRSLVVHAFTNFTFAKYVFTFLTAINPQMQRLYSNPRFICEGMSMVC